MPREVGCALSPPDGPDDDIDTFGVVVRSLSAFRPSFLLGLLHPNPICEFSVEMIRLGIKEV